MSIRVVKNSDNTDGGQVAQLDRSTSELKALLRDLFRMRHEGVAYSKLAHAQGRVDGYMQMMSDLGMMNELELLEFVADVRRGSDGPAVKRIDTTINEPALALQPTRAIA